METDDKQLIQRREDFKVLYRCIVLYGVFIKNQVTFYLRLKG